MTRRGCSSRRVFLGGLGFSLATAWRPGQAWPAGRPPRIGYLSPDRPPAFPSFWDGVRDGGLPGADPMAAEYRWAEGRTERLASLAAELVSAGVDVIFAWGYLATAAAKRTTATVPVVFVTHADPVGAGFVASLSRPGGNLTGLTLMAPDLAGKRLQLLKEMVGGLSRIAVLANAANPGEEAVLTQIDQAAAVLNLRVQVLQARTPEEFPTAFAAMVQGHAAGLHVTLDPMFMQNRAGIVQRALRSHVPAIYDVKAFVDAGGLMSFGPSVPVVIHRAGTYVARILGGARPADLPVEQPTKFELVINLKTAKALGLTIPPSLLQRADQVIE